MGYGCAKAASDSLKAVAVLFGDESSNGIKFPDGSKGFFEASRTEHADGAITGTVFVLTCDNRARKKGSFKVEGNGTISRFPGLSLADRSRALTAAYTPEVQRSTKAVI